MQTQSAPVQTRKVFTTAPRSLDILANADHGVVGKHRIGYPVRLIEVPAEEFCLYCIEVAMCQHMAIDEQEFRELVGKGLISLTEGTS